jgi:hypothetical protein
MLGRIRVRVRFGSIIRVPLDCIRVRFGSIRVPLDRIRVRFGSIRTRWIASASTSSILGHGSRYGLSINRFGF